jgi:opacity protein-like surface antigen
MRMYRFARKTLFAGLLAGVAGPAFAADLYEEPIIEVVPEIGGWYIRGYLGMSNQFFDGLESDLFDVPLEHGWHDDGGFASAPIVGGGIGYEFNDYLRGDLTVEWRGKSDFDALDWVNNGGLDTTNEYTAKKSELVFMANGYYDFGAFYGFTPYVGAGIGASYNTISNFRDTNIINSGGGYADDNSEWNFAWALHAGLGFQATDRMTIDFGYSFISLGDAETGTLHNNDGVSFPEGLNETIKFNDIYSHDFKLGIRYAIN